MDEFFKALKNIGYGHGSYLETFDRERPYNGQPHTYLGERGKQEIRGITMRDLHDAAVRAFYHASRLPSEKYPETVFELDLSHIDPVAVIQSMACEIEKMMGIYPNLPRK